MVLSLSSYKACPVPYAVKPMVDQELDRQVDAGIAKKVPYNEWSSPVVVVPKADRTVRLCGYYKVSLNQALEFHKYPIPKLENMLASPADISDFAKLDLSTAYSELGVSPGSKPLLTLDKVSTLKLWGGFSPCHFSRDPLPT